MSRSFYFWKRYTRSGFSIDLSPHVSPAVDPFVPLVNILMLFSTSTHEIFSILYTSSRRKAFLLSGTVLCTLLLTSYQPSVRAVLRKIWLEVEVKWTERSKIGTKQLSATISQYGMSK